MSTLYKRGRAASKTRRSRIRGARKQHRPRSGSRPSPPRAVTAAYQHPDGLAVTLLPLAKSVARQMLERLPRHANLDDLESAGVLGLLKAVRNFDARRHVKIEAYARHRIRGAILDSLRQMDSVSRDVRQKSRNVEKVYRRLQGALGRPVGDDEMASAFGANLTEWYAAVRNLNGVDLGWMRPNRIPEAKGSPEREPVANAQDSPFELCYRAEQRALLDQASAFLPEKQRTVIELYYERELTMKEAGHEMGIKESRVSQIHRDAITRLKANLQRLMQPSYITG